jgi:glycine oxidase
VLRLGLAVPDDHVIDPRRLTAALAEGLRRAGGELLASTAVTSLTVSQGRVAGIVLADGEAIVASHVVVAAGAWSPELAGLDPDAHVPIRPVKGQILFMHDPAGPGLLTRVLRMSGGYIVPRGDGRYVLGATMEERGFDTTVTAGAMFSLLRDAAELLPGVSELVIDELCAGLRPASPDSAPSIGPGAVSGLHWATGHYRNGILLAPITADIVLSGILGEDGGADWAAPFSPRRFAGVAV